MNHIKAHPVPILMIAYTYYESDTRVIREAEAAVEGGFEVDFLALRRPGSLREEVIRGVRVIRLNQAKHRGSGYVNYFLEYVKFFLRCLFAASSLFLRRRYRVVHVNNMPDFMVFSAIIPRLCGAKVILDIHDPMPNTFVSKFRGNEGGFFFQVLLLQERLSAMFSSQVITVHHPVKENILMKHGLAGRDIEVIANFPDESVFPTRRTYPLTGRIRCVFHGTILERSGLRVVLQAIAQVRHRGDISLLIVGEGDFSDGVKSAITELAIGDMVEFDNRSYPTHTVAERISNCNVGLVPLEISSATNHALPLKLLEYISMGLPVVSVRNEAISYYLRDNDCLFFKWDSPASLAEVMDRLVEQPELLQAFRERSLALRSRFSWTVEKQKYVSLLRRLVGVSETEHAAATQVR